MKRIILILCLFLFSACNAEDQKASSVSDATPATEKKGSDSIPGFNLTEVVKGLFVHHGVQARIDDPRHADIANIGFIIGDDCVAVIDTGGSLEIGVKLRQSIRNITDRPICYVINSHVHFDHVLGNAAFREDKPKFVGHKNLADEIEQNRDFFLKSFGADLGENPTPDLIIGPDTLVESTMEIDLGNRKLLLTANPKAHTAADLTILDEKTNTLWLADLLFMQRIPVVDGSLVGWYKLMMKLHDQKYARVIPGHGPVSAQWPAAMEPQQHYFKVLIDETRKAIADGAFIGDAVKSVALSEKDKWLFFDPLNQRNVSRTYRELEWE